MRYLALIVNQGVTRAVGKVSKSTLRYLFVYITKIIGFINGFINEIYEFLFLITKISDLCRFGINLRFTLRNLFL